MWQVGENALYITGPAGQIEALTALPDNDRKNTIVIICHPHPLQEGSMHNKVVYMISRTFLGMGFKTLRFNYRGVGESAGHYGHGEGETEDCLAVLDWAKQQYPDHTIYLAGFSFGSYIAANAAQQRQEDVTQLINIAPAVEHFNFFTLDQVDCPWLVIYGDADDVVSPQAIADWARKMEPKPQVITIPGGGHFFHGRLNELRHVLELEFA